MRISYVSRAMDEDSFVSLFTDKTNMPGQQAQKFHRLLMQGLVRNQIAVKSICGVPVTSGNCKKKVILIPDTTCNDVRFLYLPTLNLPLVKNVVHMLGAFFSVLKDSLFHKDNVIVCDVLQASVAKGASLAAALTKRTLIGIVTDLPDLMVTGGSPRYVKMVNSVIKQCTHYVFLTEAMSDVVNPKGKPYVVVEGFCDIDMQNSVRKPGATEGKKICLYAGLLDARYGVKAMIEAFLAANIPDAELHLYGSGSYVAELETVVREHSNIVYHGTVMVDEVVQAELEASLLINPRPTTEEFTKYSFPSKNMEYMVSGTPVLTTKLPGMPDEYNEYVYLFEGETVDGMAKTISEVLQQPQAVREEKGRRAKQFVLEKKNNVAQAKRILQLIEQTHCRRKND